MSLPDPQEVRRVAVLGTGTIGASWTTYFLARGMEVCASDPAPDWDVRLRAFVDRAWPDMVRLGLQPGAAADRVRFFSDPAEAVDGTAFVQENAPERLDVKRALYGLIAPAFGDDTVLASSTSGLLISDMQAGQPHGSRFVTGHPFNPPHLIPLVEVVGGTDTAPAVMDWAIEFYNAHGKRAIRVNREIPGHLANRLQVAMWREAVHLVTSGVASAADVDAAIAYGPGLRWAIMGPMLTFHLAGGRGGAAGMMEHFGPAIENWWADLGAPHLTPEVRTKVVERIDEEVAGQSMDQLEKDRDKLLMALLQTLREARKGTSLP